MTETQMEMFPLPSAFCVAMMMGQRNGYAFIQSHSEHLPDGHLICTLKSKKHQNTFFTIINSREYVLQHQSIWRDTLTKKSNGHVQRTTRWRNTGEALNHLNNYYPVIKFTATTTILPSISAECFIPIRQQNEVRNTIPSIPKSYPIDTIPQHVIRALLRDAAMQEEMCPITGDEIDITNGAVTTCFHLFDKDAIATWLSLPNSQDKCPVCNAKCNIYLLDDSPPGLNRAM